MFSNEDPVSIEDRSHLEELKSLYQNINWENEEERVELLPRLANLFGEWTGTLPNLREIFQPKEIDQLLLDTVNSMINDKFDYEKLYQIIDFVVRTGYKDEPIDGKPLSRRTTAVHRLANEPHLSVSFDTLFGVLFKIYDKCEVNYTDEETGMTHFHAACGYGCEDIVLKFLELGQDPNCLVPKVDISPLHMALKNMGGKRVIESLLRSGSDPNFADAKGLTPLHYICFGTGQGGDDLAEMFFEVCDDRQQVVLVDAVDNLGDTSLLLSLRFRNERMLKLLLKRGANPNVAHPKGGRTPLHQICLRAGRGGADLAEIFFKTCDDMQQKVQVDAVDSTGHTPFRLLFHEPRVDEQLMRLLLRRGANPNFTFSNGSTPLHIICVGSDVDSCEWLETFLKINEEINQLVHVNVQNNKGETPLHLALRTNGKKVAKRLLRIGADPTLTNADGSTPLHIICEFGNSEDLLKLFFKVCNEIRQKVQVDARDKFGRTPLNVALLRRRRKFVQLLLRNGANPNLVSADGLTPYWVILCQVKYDVDLAKSFLETCVEIQRRVQINDRNSFGQTPLEWAVACLELQLVDVILDHGADLSDFAFPPVSFFGERLKPMPHEGHMFKLRVVSSVQIIVENLERRGYELNRSDALTIMKSFVEYESSEMFEDLDQCQRRWYDDEEFVNKSKEIMMNSSLSLYDLIRLRPEEAEKSLTYADYLNLALSDDLSGLPELDKQTCAEHLCEKLARGIFRSWALDSFLELTNLRFPILCCEMIIDNLKNKDLLNVCLAGTQAQSSRES